MSLRERLIKLDCSFSRAFCVSQRLDGRRRAYRSLNAIRETDASVSQRIVGIDRDGPIVVFNTLSDPLRREFPPIDPAFLIELISFDVVRIVFGDLLLFDPG